MAYWNEVDHHLGRVHLDHFWLNHPRVRAYVNRCVTGSEEVWPTAWFEQAYSELLPLRESLVLGCGTGNLDRDLVQRGISARVVGVDVAEKALAYARERARLEGLADRITYVCADGREYLNQLNRSVPSIFFHGALHHFDRMNELLALVRERLDPDGLLYLDEYVGLSMRDWNWRRLLLANLAYYLLPRRARRPWLVRAPINPQDPSEAICAGEILEAVYKHFHVRERRDYGGNLVNLVYPNLRKPGTGDASPSEAAFDRAVARLISLERLLLRVGRPLGLASHHTVIVAQPRPGVARTG